MISHFIAANDIFANLPYLDKHCNAIGWTSLINPQFFSFEALVGNYCETSYCSTEDCLFCVEENQHESQSTCWKLLWNKLLLYWALIVLLCGRKSTWITKHAFQDLVSWQLSIEFLSGKEPFWCQLT
jgi:hypothetical protein